MSKAKAKATKEVVEAKEEDSNSSVSWIPCAPSGAESKKQDLSISTILELKFISTKLDKFGRYSSYFVCQNPEALTVLKEYIDTQGLDIKQLSLPFWAGDSGEIVVRAGKQHVSLTDEQLNESALLPMRVATEFRYYSGKTKSGFSIHL
jgi:hypothetical protein